LNASVGDAGDGWVWDSDWIDDARVSALGVSRNAWEKSASGSIQNIKFLMLTGCQTGGLSRLDRRNGLSARRDGLGGALGVD
jgi:hypothetical protein